MWNALVNWWNGEDGKEKAKVEAAKLVFPVIPSKWICDVDNLKLDGEVLGTGGFTVVYSGRLKGVDVAVKSFESRSGHSVCNHFNRSAWKPTTDPLDALRGDEREVFEAEVNVLARIWDQGGHASIIRWFGATHKALSPWNAIILESCDGGSFKYTLYVQGANLKLAFVLKVYQQVASALQFLHSHKIIHRDVKAANVLLLKHAEDTNNARLADFGLAKFKEDTHRSPSRTLSLMDLSVPVGTRLWMAPELLDEADYDERVDVYSLGVTFLESFLRESMKGNVLFDVLETKQYGIFKRPKLPSNISPDALVQLIDRSMDVDPEKRPMAKEIAKSIGKILQKVSKEETLPPIPK